VSPCVFPEASRFVATLLVPRKQVKTVLVECIRAGEELETQAEIVENTGGHAGGLLWCCPYSRQTSSYARLASFFVLSTISADPH
jgi:hypothetical protein